MAAPILREIIDAGARINTWRSERQPLDRGGEPGVARGEFPERAGELARPLVEAEGAGREHDPTGLMADQARGPPADRPVRPVQLEAPVAEPDRGADDSRRPPGKPCPPAP